MRNSFFTQISSVIYTIVLVIVIVVDLIPHARLPEDLSIWNLPLQFGTRVKCVGHLT
jgi:hypothetical protein